MEEIKAINRRNKKMRVEYDKEVKAFEEKKKRGREEDPLEDWSEGK